MLQLEMIPFRLIRQSSEKPRKECIKMKIILLEDVKSLGKKGDVVEVSTGYARNFLIPKKKGLEATDKNLNELRLKKKNEARVAQGNLEEAQNLAAEMQNLQIEIPIKVGEGGRAFGSVSSKEISDTAKKQLKLIIDKKKIQLNEPIKTLGTHIAYVKLHPQVIGELKVVVIEQD